MLLRELIVALRLKTFKSDFAKAEGAISKVKIAAQGAAAVMAAGIAFRSLKSIVEDGSRAEEVLNVLQNSFREFTPEVISWAGEMSTAMGRSKFELREYATDLQALLVPMTQNRKESKKMALSLTELAVDLSSFRDVDMLQTLRAIKSGLSGEVEPLRNAFGINLTIEALAEFAGTSKEAVTKLKGLAKAQLRYDFILSRSQDALGDAQRTAHAYSNTMRRLRGAIKDLRTQVGVALLPDFTASAARLATVVRWLEKIASKTTFVEASFVTLKAAAVILGIILLKVFAGPLIVIAAVGLAIFAIITIVEEVMAFFDDSVDGFAEGIVKDFPEAMGVLADVFKSLIEDTMGWIGGLFTDTLALMGGLVDDMIDLAKGVPGAVKGFFGIESDDAPSPGARAQRFTDALSPLDRELASINGRDDPTVSPGVQFLANMHPAVREAELARERLPGGTRLEPNIGAPTIHFTVQGDVNEGTLPKVQQMLNETAAAIPVRN